MQWTRDIYHYEPTPPQGIWDKINFELDNEISDVRNTLKNFTEEPPAGVWMALKKELYHEVQDARLKWYRSPAGLIAAASLTGIIFLAFYLIINKDTFKPADIATSIHSTESKTPEISPGVKKGNRVSPLVETIHEIAPSIDDFADNKKVDYPALENHRNKNYTLASIDIVKLSGKMLLPESLPARRDYHLLQAVQFNDGNYIHIISPDGNNMRVSYKLQEMIPAIRNNIENPQLKEWKEKIQSSAFIPSSNNFFDISAMIKLLEEHK